MPAKQNRLIVHYQDDTGELLNEDLSIFGAVGSAYAINAPTFRDYILDSTSKPLQGEMPAAENASVTLVYRRLGRVIVRGVGPEQIIQLQPKTDDPRTVAPVQLKAIPVGRDYYVKEQTPRKVTSIDAFVPTYPTEDTLVQAMTPQEAAYSPFQTPSPESMANLAAAQPQEQATQPKTEDLDFSDFRDEDQAKSKAEQFPWEQMGLGDSAGVEATPKPAAPTQPEPVAQPKPAAKPAAKQAPVESPAPVKAPQPKPAPQLEPAVTEDLAPRPAQPQQTPVTEPAPQPVAQTPVEPTPTPVQTEPESVAGMTGPASAPSSAAERKRFSLMSQLKSVLSPEPKSSAAPEPVGQPDLTPTQTAPQSGTPLPQTGAPVAEATNAPESQTPPAPAQEPTAPVRPSTEQPAEVPTNRRLMPWETAPEAGAQKVATEPTQAPAAPQPKRVVRQTTRYAGEPAKRAAVVQQMVATLAKQAELVNRNVTEALLTEAQLQTILANMRVFLAAIATLSEMED